MSEILKPQEEPEKPKRIRPPAKPNLKDLVDKHPLRTVCSIIAATSISVFTVMQLVWSYVQVPRYEQRLETANQKMEESIERAKEGNDRVAVLLHQSQVNQKNIAELENNLRISQQSLSLLKEQNTIAKETLAERAEAQQKLDKVLSEQFARNASLKETVAKLETSIAIKQPSGQRKEQIESLSAQISKQRSIFYARNVDVHKTWQLLALTHLNGEDHLLRGRLEAGPDYKTAYHELAKVKRARDSFLEFQIWNSGNFASVQAAIEEEMWKRYEKVASSDEQGNNITKTIGAELPQLADWEQLFSNSPGLGDKSVEDWLKEIVRLQKDFHEKQFRPKPNTDDKDKKKQSPLNTK